ncbi:hypothetical protein HKD37_19G053009 [Glycine soja]
MIESFHRQDQMSVLELYIEKNVAGGSMFHYANSLTSCGNNLSNNEAEPPRNVSNLHGDEDDDDDDYLVSNSYVEDSLDEDDSVDDISDIDDEVTNMIQPIRIVHPAEGVEKIQNLFWNDALHYNNINWSHPDQEDICGLEMPSSFNVGQQLYVGIDFNSKDAVKNALKQYVMKVHQSFKVVESKSNKYIVCCSNKSEECPCPFYTRAILSKKTYSWNEAAILPSDDAWKLIPDPTTIRAKGRPKSTRIRNEMDWLEPSEHRQKCSRCGAEGHNRHRCPMQYDRGSCSFN